MSLKNLCGKCNVCCTNYRIDKINLPWRDTDKEINETCDKLVNNRCVVYKTRLPKSCKEYECLWFQLLPHKWHPEFRPDKIGINVNTTHDESGRFIFNIEELEEGKIDLYNLSPEADSFLKSIFELEKQQQGQTLVTIFFYGMDKGYPITRSSACQKLIHTQS